ncbi:sigma-54 dependent transcriptional regulator PrdR [Clostridium sp. DL1XJH146]
MFLYSKNFLVRDVMSKNFNVFKENCELDKAIESMLRNKYEEIFVENKNEELIGVLTFVDISRIMQNNDYSRMTLKEFLNCNLMSVSSNVTLLECRNIMVKNKIGRMPVVDYGKLVGVIRKNEILQYFYKTIEDSSMKLDHILNSIYEAVCVVDTEGIVVLWNKKSEKLYGVLQKDILGKPIKNFFPNALILKVLKTKVAYENVNHEPKKDCHMIITSSPIWIDGEFAGAVSTDRDISKVKKLASELQKANDTLKFLQGEMNRYSQADFGGVVGKSKQIIDKIEIARKVAGTKAAILITGESGTGKEVFSRAIHNYSGEKGHFIPVNCSAIPDGLFESEFFGYEQGAFTGANKKGKIGLFEMAQGGTIFLDEIGDMPLFMQAKLLRVLQEKQIIRVGGNKYIPINTRVISATNKNLIKMVENDEFREDLYYRINVVEINLPPLRKRKGDIPLLVNTFLEELSKKNGKKIPQIDKNTMKIIQNYRWKGNIRELKNTIENLIVLSKDEYITSDLIPEYMIKDMDKKVINDENLDLKQSIKELEIKLIKKALVEGKGNKAKAAELLNIPRATLYYKMDSYKIK